MATNIRTSLATAGIRKVDDFANLGETAAELTAGVSSILGGDETFGTWALATVAKTKVASVWR